VFLIIPGILFLVWFSLTLIIFVFEQRKGFDALFFSKELTRGYFWKLLWRLLALEIILIIVTTLTFFLVRFIVPNSYMEFYVGGMVGYFTLLFFVPFIIIYLFLIYKNLIEINSNFSYTEPPKKTKLKYFIPISLGLLIVAIGVFFNFLIIFLGRDIPPIDDSDLWLSAVEIPKEENAFYYLKDIDYISIEDHTLLRKMAEGEEWDHKYAEELIKNNEKFFEDFEKILILPYYQEPGLKDPILFNASTILHTNPDLRTTIINLGLFKVRYLFIEGEEEEAFDLLIKIIKFGHLVENKPRPVLIYWLIGISLKNSGLELFRELIPKANILKNKSMFYIDELKKIEQNESGLVRSFQMEYILSVNTINDLDFLNKEDFGFLYNHNRLMNYIYRPNQTQLFLAETYRKLINNAEKNYYNEMVFYEPPDSSIYSMAKIFLKGNSPGKIISEIILINLRSSVERRLLIEFLNKGNQILLAIRAYQIEKGELPVSLEELVPKYLDSVPKDPFDGELIRYSKEKRIIYSVGKSLEDLGGSEGENWLEMKNPTFKIKSDIEDF